MKSFRNKFTLGRTVNVTDVRFEEIRDCGSDGFRLRVDASGTCVVEHSGARGKRYAIGTLRAFGNAVPIGRIEDYADFTRRGVVEGFYGRPYSFADRRNLLDFMDAVRMNLYLYAPKDDPFHRAKWRQPYPDDVLDELSRLGAYAREREIELCYCISPGLDMRYSDEKEHTALAGKLKSLEAAGIRSFALLFDDIDAKLTESDAQAFSSAAEAQAVTCDRLQQALGKAVLFCPTDYWQNTDTPYRQALRQRLPKDAAVLWTGYNTVAEYIDNTDGEQAREWLGGAPMLWDNYPVSDFMPERLFLGALRNRDTRLHETHAGMVMNPMDRPELSKFALYTAAAYMWNAAAYDPDRAEAEAAAMLVPQAPQEALGLIRDNAASVLYDPGTLADPIERARRYRRLKKALPPALEAELADYFEYAALENRAYRAALEGRDISRDIDKLNASGIRTARNA